MLHQINKAMAKPTNKEVYNNGEVITSYPCDINGSNQSIELLVEYQGKEYVVHTDWDENLLKPNSIANQINK